jgi:integrase
VYRQSDGTLTTRSAKGCWRAPCANVPALPVEPGEIEYVRLNEIEPYPGACAARYAALAEFLIGTGVRVSEAVATRWPDMDVQRAGEREIEPVDHLGMAHDRRREVVDRENQLGDLRRSRR